MTGQIVRFGLVIWLGCSAPAAADGVMLVRAGAFWMGGDDRTADERPRHRVFVPDFWIDRHKVTNAEFAAFLDARGPMAPDGQRRYDADDADARIRMVRTGTPPDTRTRWVVDTGFERHPAVEVSWFGARDYCAWRGRRLPTEAEWEKAARGDDGRAYPWGSAPPAPHLAVSGRPYNATEPGDARPGGRSPYGVDDMLGNLREWTSTKLAPYPYRADDGREPFDGKPAERGADARGGQADRVVLRGASHDDPAASLHLASRHSYDRRGASAGHHHVGFRCATSEDLGEVAPGGQVWPPR